MKNKLVKLFIAYYVITSMSVAAQTNITLGRADFQIYRAARSASEPGFPEPNIVIRVQSEKGNREMFVITNEIGTMLLPLRPGKYCFDIFNNQGYSLDFDKSQHFTCFEVLSKRDYWREVVGITLPHDYDDPKHSVVNRPMIDLGYAHFQTLRATMNPSNPPGIDSGVIVRIKKDKEEMFAIPNGDGIVRVPFRPGEYCFDTFDIKGKRLELDKNNPDTCFNISQGKDIEVKVVIAPQK